MYNNWNEAIYTRIPEKWKKDNITGLLNTRGKNSIPFTFYNIQNFNNSNI